MAVLLSLSVFLELTWVVFMSLNFSFLELFVSVYTLKLVITYRVYLRMENNSFYFESLSRYIVFKESRWQFRDNMLLLRFTMFSYCWAVTFRQIKWRPDKHSLPIAAKHQLGYSKFQCCCYLSLLWYIRNMLL